MPTCICAFAFIWAFICTAAGESGAMGAFGGAGGAESSI
jgi:hypothetical protein